MRHHDRRHGAELLFIGVAPGTFLVTTGAISGTLPIQKAGLGT